MRNTSSTAKSLAELEDRVEKFIEQCQEYCRVIKTKSIIESNVTTAQLKKEKRRIKPTLVASFGLLSINKEGGTGTFTRQQREDANLNEKSNNERPFCVDEEWGEYFSKNHQQWWSSPIIISIERSRTPTDLLYLLSKILKYGNQLFSCTFQVDHLPKELPFVSGIIRDHVNLLLAFAPSHRKILESNRFFSIVQSQIMLKKKNKDNAGLDTSTFRKSLAPLTSSDDSSDTYTLDGIPLPYNDRRDSRNPSGGSGITGLAGNNGVNKSNNVIKTDHRRSVLHANQQKIRDALHSWLRKQSPNYTFEVIHMVQMENFSWFAELLLCEFDQLEKYYTKKKGTGTKLDKLEERLTTSRTANENPIISLISGSDSFQLCRALTEQLFEVIENGILQAIIDGNKRSEPQFSNEILRLFTYGRLLACCTARQIGRYEDPILCFIRDMVDEGIKNNHLISILPMMISWLKNAPWMVESMSSIIYSMQKNLYLDRIDPNAIAIRILINALPSDKNENAQNENDQVKESSTSLSDKELTAKDPFFNKPLDDDQSICLERILGNCVPEFKSWHFELALINNSIDNAMMVNTTSNNPNVNIATTIVDNNIIQEKSTLINNTNMIPLTTTVTFPPPSSSSSAAAATVQAPRKVRPVTEALGEAQLQKRLRQWFWWQHPALCDLVNAICSYLKNELAVIRVEDVIPILWSIMPKLLPAVLGESESVQKIIICLVVEIFKGNQNGIKDSA